MEVIYENDQWIVDEKGMICKEGNGHDLTIQEIFNLTNWSEQEWTEKKLVYNAPLHYSGKSWVNISCFIDAWVKAIDHHQPDSDSIVSAEALERSITLARNFKNDHILVNSIDRTKEKFRIRMR